MNRNGTKDRIHVTPNDPYIYIMITMFVLMAIKSLQDDLLPLSIVHRLQTPQDNRRLRRDYILQALGKHGENPLLPDYQDRGELLGPWDLHGLLYWKGMCRALLFRRQ